MPIADRRLFHAALLGAGVTATLKEYDHGPHGFGLADGSGGTPVDAVLAGWPGLARDWLEASGFLRAATGLALLRPRLRAIHAMARKRDAAGRKIPQTAP